MRRARRRTSRKRIVCAPNFQRWASRSKTGPRGQFGRWCRDGEKGVGVVTRERLYLFDTTLRDGAQTQGVDFSVEDKRQIALALDELGIDYIEGGFPGANPTDT